MGTGASMDVRIAAGALSGGFSALIANPLGGGIYVEVPYGADLGIIEV